MLELARNSDGNHAFARDPSDLIQIFNREFNDVLAACAQTVSIDIELRPGVKAVKEIWLRSAQAMGADLAYIGSAFIATTEANASDAYKQMIVDSSAGDIVYTNLFTGVLGNYLKGSITKAGLDPDNLPQSDPSKMSFAGGEGSKAKAWKDIWGAGQGVGAVREIVPAAALIARLKREYDDAKRGLCGT